MEVEKALTQFSEKMPVDADCETPRLHQQTAELEEMLQKERIEVEVTCSSELY